MERAVEQRALLEAAMTILLAIDPNTRRSGLAMGDVTDDAPGLVKLVQAESEDEMRALLRAHIWQYRPDVVAIEGTYLGANPHSALVLAGLVGYIEALAHTINVRTCVLSTAEIDSLCGLPLRMDRAKRKAATGQLARLLLSRQVTEDEGDAVCLWLAACGKEKERSWKEQSA